MNALKQSKYVGIIWLIARIWLGYEWLMAGIEKVFGEGSAVWVGGKAGVAVTGFLKGAIAKSPLAPGFDAAQNAHPAVQTWYATLARDVFMPNAALFSYLVAYGELLVGLALILGIFTHFSALMGVLMNLAYLFAGTTSTNPQLLVVGLTIVLAGGVAVGYYGVDYFLRPIETQVFGRVRSRFAAPTSAPQPI
jgi:thiosulfate dehydrogenase [quinone] large subunit